MNEDFISSSMEIGMRVPIGGPGGGGGGGVLLPSAFAMIAGEPIKSPTVSHGTQPHRRCARVERRSGIQPSSNSGPSNPRFRVSVLIERCRDYSHDPRVVASLLCVCARASHHSVQKWGY